MASDDLSIDGLAELTVREAQAALTRVLGAAGIDEPGRDARILVHSALGMSAADVLREPDRRVMRHDAEMLAGMALRRLAREPISRILGYRAFFGRRFDIAPATLDPRPCTETLIEAVLELAVQEGWKDAPLRILDIGTGSGAILVTLLAELPQATGIGSDVSADALAIARRNAERIGVGPRATFQFARTLEGLDGPFDLLVSNPPYIASADIADLDPEVRDYDPAAALDGGTDGLDFYREIAAGFARFVPHGWAVFEVGAGQADAVAGLLLEAAGAEAVVRTWLDLGRHTRCVAARTHSYPSR